MHELKKGTLKSGKDGKGGKVKSRKQAIAIGISEARAEGAKVPAKKTTKSPKKKKSAKTGTVKKTDKKVVPKKTSAKKSNTKKVASRETTKSATKKKTASAKK